ncbi:Thioesterase superfamily protein [Venustampulla echinocandica]|uniref:Thioesterase superfamily protein n=1 Tax=Venustampulla echinocandica TaxID=2656787 RepID=A0A370TKI6_9HELO|nr:Thioesterase superfamily protein [Venustampulla echinocandica]RDL36029.1 Thioesterase superfamily protein [Venustampulla echinocandica]
MEEPDLAHFQSIPWCSALLQDPTFVITPTDSRQPKASTEDSLTAETLKTHNAIRACISFYKCPTPGESWIPEVRTLVTLGSGMNGFPDVLHGGIIATLMDDVMGILTITNERHDGDPLSNGAVTAQLNVSYLKKVPTPATVLVVARCREVTAKKYLMDAEIRDSEGVVLAKADSLWVRIKGRQPNL